MRLVSTVNSFVGSFARILCVGLLSVTLGCSTTTRPVSVVETREHPTWYVECEQIGTEGFIFFNRSQWAYSCGMGQSRYEQASEAQAYAFAIKGFAERINGEVAAQTTVELTSEDNAENRSTRTFVEHSVTNTSIREHLEVKRHAYELEGTGQVHTYVRIKMPLEIFNQLLAEAKTLKADGG